MISSFRALADWTRAGLLTAFLTTGLVAEDAAITGTPATLPLADGAKILIQGTNYYVNPIKDHTLATLTSGYVRPMAWKLYPTNESAPHLLAQDSTPTAANVFTVTVVPKPASFPAEKSFGPDCQFVVLRAASGKYVCFLDDDTLGPTGDSIDQAQILLVDRGEPFRIFIAPVTYAQRLVLHTFRWPRVAGAQLLFWQQDNVVLLNTFPRPPDNPPTAGVVRLLLVK